MRKPSLWKVPIYSRPGGYNDDFTGTWMDATGIDFVLARSRAVQMYVAPLTVCLCTRKFDISARSVSCILRNTDTYTEIYTCVSTRTRTHACIPACIYTYTHTHLFCMHVRVHTFENLYAGACANTCAHAHMHTRTQTDMSNAFAYASYVCMSVCTFARMLPVHMHI